MFIPKKLETVKLAGTYIQAYPCMMVSVSIATPAVDERVVWRLQLIFCVDAAMVVLFLAISRGEGLASESQANVLLKVWKNMDRRWNFVF